MDYICDLMDNIRMRCADSVDFVGHSHGAVMDKPITDLKRSDHLALSLLYGGIVQYRAGETLKPRVLPDWELVLIIEGQVSYRANGRDYPAPPGSVILARPGFHESYQWDTRRKTRHAYFHFDIEAVPSGWPPPPTWPAIRTSPDPLVPAIFRNLLGRLATSPSGPTGRPPTDQCHLVELLIEVYLEQHVMNDPRAVQQRPEPVCHAINLMRQTLDESPSRSLTLGDVASAACVSEKHLCRLFQNSLGRSPMQTYRLMKLQLAAVLLGQSNLNVREIADRCGFEDQFYFSRCFAKTCGRSPTEYRKQLRAGSPPLNSLLPLDIMPRVYW
ncbi:MAG: AraC family transcriptional regulator [Planctomycetota bacterium]